MSTLEERAQADSDDSDRFAGTQADTLTSFVKTSGALVKVTAERDQARAALGRVTALCDKWNADNHWYGDDRDDRADALDFGADLLREAMKPRCTCTGLTSQSGVDQNNGPDKVWRCDECSLIWEPTNLKGTP